MNDTVKWVLLAVVGYFIWEEFSQSDLASTVGTTTAAPTTGTTTTTPATTTTASTTPAAASVQLTSTVQSLGSKFSNALKATFSINGSSEQIAVIPGGDAYNDAGQSITAALATLGVTPAQLYALMSAGVPATSAGSAGSPTVTTAPGHAYNLGVRGINALAQGPTVHLRQAPGGKWVM